MKISKVELEKSGNPTSIVKAYGYFELDGALKIDVVVFEMDKGPWMSYSGSKKFKGKDGKTGWAKPIHFNDLAFEERAKEEVLSYYRNNIVNYDSNPTSPAISAKSNYSKEKKSYKEEEDEFPF